MTTRILIALAAVAALPAWVDAAPSTNPPPAPLRTYPLDRAGALLYTPLSNEARRTGKLPRNTVAGAPVSLKVGGAVLKARVPRSGSAYGLVAIPYTLSAGSATAGPVAVEATAFEDEGRRKARNLFDLALPGRLALDVSYLGSITAHMRPGGRHNIKADMSDKPGTYPGFDRKPFVRSGVVEAGDIIWFRFRVKNTGNTILDPEGFGGWGLYPELCAADGKGGWTPYSYHYNLYIRDRKYLYPGETHDFWINFRSNQSWDSYKLPPGSYMLRFRSYYRYYRDWNDWLNMWDGAWMHNCEMPITLAEKPAEAPVAPMVTTLADGLQPDKITRYIGKLEEFMTSFDVHQSRPAAGKPIQGTLYLQLAPWTRHVVVKLITTGPVQCATIASPITVSQATVALKPKLHPGNCMVANGRRVPVVYSQLMQDMRSNIQVSPWPEKDIVTGIRRMLECGVNICATTAMPWLYADFDKPRENHTGDGMKYALDVARREGMKLEAWGSYPFDRSTVSDIYRGITGKRVAMDVYNTDGYPAVSHSDPHIAEANAAIWLYQFKRWGDAYAQFEDGRIPFGTEDTRGWMRQDVDIRFPMGKLTLAAFQDWLRDRYLTVDRLNSAWGTAFASFRTIDPEDSGQVNRFGHHWEYRDSTKPFHDWNRAMADWDEFRTQLRIRNYSESLSLVHREVPQAAMILRTEGANAIVDGLDPADPNPHFRHAYLSQRRVAAIAPQIRKSGAFAYHSDYTTIPYTESELRKLTRAGVAQGIIPAWLPGFDNMRDIALNTKHGVDYTTNYNSSTPVLGAMMHVLTPVFPWFQAVIEEGGIPGLLWEDLQCDGFTTETQERELLIYKRAMQAYLASPAGRKAATTGLRIPDRSWLKRVTPKQSYRLDGTSAGNRK